MKPLKHHLIDFGVYVFAEYNEGKWWANIIWKIAVKFKLWRFL